ncbi:MAG: Uma2 family endonuclease [Pirellulaceae bacterium]|nr:Uma2 family endonuclease [Pirellulaceae bacterium]
MSARNQIYSLEEYLALEEVSEDRHEFYRGEIFQVAGNSVQHSRITRNLLVQLALQLRGKTCEPFGCNQRIAVAEYPFHTYPDVSVICGKLVMDAIDKQAVTNPHTLLEVVSPSTEKYDRGQKFECYRKLDSLRGYILVAQDQACAEVFVRKSRFEWLLTAYQGLDAVVDLTDIGCRLTMTDTYEGVEFREDEERSR